MISIILHNLKTSHLIPIKLLRLIRHLYYKKKYDYSIFEKKQNEIFDTEKLNRQSGLIKLNKIKKQFNFFNRMMSSEYEIIFSSISINKKINNILEIGTFNGVNAFLLSQIFSEAKIITIDLKKDSDEYKNSYKRKDKINEFIKQRDIVLGKSKNIFFKELNSLNLINQQNKYDLIFIDGNHSNPVVTIDIINSLNLINQNGIILCDDIWLKDPEKKIDMLDSKDSYDTLKALQNEKIINLTLFYKRLDINNNCNPSRRKYLAYITLPKKN